MLLAAPTGSFLEVRMTDASTEAEEHSEGAIARTIENQTAKLPSDTFLWAALGVMGAAVYLSMTDRKHFGLLLGQWGPALLLFGLYDKLVKVAGSDRAGRFAGRGAGEFRA
jgi:hypothetical protein